MGYLFVIYIYIYIYIWPGSILRVEVMHISSANISEVVSYIRIAINRISCVNLRCAHLHLHIALTHYKGQVEYHAYFDCEHRTDRKVKCVAFRRLSAYICCLFLVVECNCKSTTRVWLSNFCQVIDILDIFKIKYSKIHCFSITPWQLWCVIFGVNLHTEVGHSDTKRLSNR